MDSNRVEDDLPSYGDGAVTNAPGKVADDGPPSYRSPDHKSLLSFGSSTSSPMREPLELPDPKIM